MLTRFGWTALVTAALSIAVGRIFGLIELYVFGVALVVAVAISLVWVHLPMPALRVQRRTSPPQLTAGEAARTDVMITNDGQRHSPQLSLYEQVGDRGGATFQLAALAPGERVGAAYLLPTAQRGVLRCGPLRGRRTDALGLSARTHTLAGASEVLILPQTIHLSTPAVGTAGDLGQYLRAASMAQSGTEFHSMREYVPGDDLRRISWKASARSTTLMVKETVNEGLRRFTVLVDLDADQYDPLSFERAVSAAASLIGAVSSSQLEIRLAAADADFRGPHSAALAAHWLATVAPLDEPGELSSGSGSTDGLGVTTIITGSATSPAVGSLRARRTGDAIVVITTTEPGTGRMVIDGTSLSSLQRGWERLLGGESAQWTGAAQGARGSG